MARHIIFLILAPLLIVGCSEDKNPVGQGSGILSGKVTVDGIGMPGVTIAVSSYIVTGGGTPKLENYAIAMMTAADGDYRLELLPGEYRIDYSLNFDTEWLQAARYPIGVSSGQETIVNVDLRDPVPTNLILKENDATVELSWDPGYDSNLQRAYRSVSGTNNFTLIAEIPNSSSGTVHAVDIPSSIGAYDYKVTSLAGDIESAPSEQKTVQFSGTLTPPTGFNAIDQVTRVALIWDPKANASIYKIYRADSSPQNWVLLDSTNRNSYDDVPEVLGNYFYYVTAVSGFGIESLPSAQMAVAYDGRYDPLSGVLLADRGSNFYLTWTDQDYNGYFNIYRSLNPDQDMVRIDSTFNTFYEDVPTIHDHYYYRVSIVGPNELESEKSGAVGAYFDGRLDAPSQVQATDLGLSVRIEWAEILWSAAYIIYRSDDAQTYHQIARVSSIYRSYVDIPPQAGTFLYKVSTETVDGVEGSLSEAASVYFTDNLAFPENVTAQSFGTLVEVSWDYVANATGYKIFRSTSSDGGYVELGQTVIREFTDVPESAGPYYYKVRATDDIGHESPFSFHAYVYFTGIPLPPDNVTAYDELYKVDLFWESIDPTYDFIVFRSNAPEGGYYPIDTVFNYSATDWPSTADHYYYKVQAVTDQDIFSELSHYAHVYFSGILGTPSNLQADTTGGYVSLTWDIVDGAAAYDIYRGPSEIEMSLIQTVYLPACTDAPDTGGTYYYAVTAKTQGGLESSRSAPVIIVYQP